jgi:hypothetical protein
MRSQRWEDLIVLSGYRAARQFASRRVFVYPVGSTDHKLAELESNLSKIARKLRLPKRSVVTMLNRYFSATQQRFEFCLRPGVCDDEEELLFHEIVSTDVFF